MNTNNLLKQKKGISPIIATLLLILIAIAAGVIVYAYVVGFIGASTSNSGGTTDTLSIDQVSLSTKATNSPATVYVRNEGPTTESFNTGFFVKGSALNDQLVPAVSLSAVTAADTVTITAVSVAESSSSTVTVTITASSCTATTDTLNVVALGAPSTVSSACPSTGGGSLTATLTLPTGTAVSTSPAYAAATGTFTGVGITGAGTFVFGTSISAGTISLSVNNVLSLTLALVGAQVSGAASAGQYNNPLSAGQTYTVQVTGTDGASTTASAKAF